MLHLIINAQATVVLKPNQGTFPKTGCNRFRGSFFVTFFACPEERSGTRGRSKKVNKKNNISSLSAAGIRAAGFAAGQSPTTQHYNCSLKYPLVAYHVVGAANAAMLSAQHTRVCDCGICGMIFATSVVLRKWKVNFPISPATPSPRRQTV